MVHQYDHRDRQSGLSRKYTEYIENEPDVNKKIAIQSEILGVQNIPVVPTANPLSLKPNQKFIEEYEKRAILKREKQAKALVNETFNEKGEKYATIWNNEDFRKIHDPIGVFEKKGNYQDLAWKVFRNVEDENIFLKTLYYPRLVTDDYYALNHYFEEQFKSSANKTRVNYGLSILSAVGAWGLAYSFKLKRTTFFGLTLLSAYGVFSGLEHLNSRSMQNKLNEKAYDIAVKYPEIKFSQVVYTKSSEVSKRITPLY